MKIERLAIPDVVLITPKNFRDERGFFSETWNEQALLAAGPSLAPTVTVRGRPRGK